MNVQGINTGRILTYIMAAVSCSSDYTSWADKSAREHCTEALANVRKLFREEIDFSTLTAEEAIEIGFIKFTESDDNQYLIPIWMAPLIPEGTRVTSITGNVKIVGVDALDNDHRGGWSAYSMDFKPAEVEPQMDFVPRADEEE